MKKVIIWFLVVLILAIYAKSSNLMPNSGQVMGVKTAPLTKTGR